MNADKRWYRLLTVSAVTGAAVASISRRRHRRTAHDLEHTTALKSWENEGGNLAPVPAAPALP